jgi:4-hydroxy-3-methylbut-2-enyl diphosphate reductase
MSKIKRLRVKIIQSNQINEQVNERLTEMDIRILEGEKGKKDYSVVSDGDVVILPAFGATIQEMQFLDNK